MRASHPLLLLGLLAANAWTGESLYIFFPSTVSPPILQKQISMLSPEVEVIAFGRYSEFEERIAAEPPDAVLSFPEAIRPLKGYAMAVGSNRNGMASEPYYLLTIDQEIEIAHIGKHTIGAVDFLGRKGMKQFITGIFPHPPTLKTVTKIEDLLPLLTFNMVQGIFVTESQVPYFQTVSNLDFKKIRVPNMHSGTLILAVRDGGSAPKVTRIPNSMEGELLGLMGGIQWR